MSWRWNAWLPTSYVFAVRISAAMRISSCGPIADASADCPVPVPLAGRATGVSATGGLPARDEIGARIAHLLAAGLGAVLEHHARERRTDSGQAARHGLAVRLVDALEPAALEQLGL